MYNIYILYIFSFIFYLDKFKALLRDAVRIIGNVLFLYLPHFIRIMWKNPTFIDYIQDNDYNCLYDDNEKKEEEEEGKEEKEEKGDILKAIKKPYSLKMFEKISNTFMSINGSRLSEVKILNFNLCKYDSSINYITSFKSLVSLNASSTRIGNDKRIIEFVRYLPNLKVFKYSWNSVTDSEFYKFCNDLPEMKNLEDIAFASTIIYC